MSLEENLRCLSKNSLLATMQVDARRLVAFSCEVVELRPNEVLFRRGDVSDGGYLVLSGSIALKRDEFGGPSPHLAKRFFLLGEMALISETTRPVTAVAQEKTELLKISRTLFHRVLREFPDSAISVRNLIESRLKDFTSQLRESQLSRDD